MWHGLRGMEFLGGHAGSAAWLCSGQRLAGGVLRRSTVLHGAGAASHVPCIMFLKAKRKNCY
jgi:hypothetical protein